MTMKPTLTTYHDPGDDLQNPACLCVVVPSLLRPTLIDCIRSLYHQDLKEPFQILIGVDQNKAFDWDILIRERPARVRLTLFWPGYSTNKRHGGQYEAFGGGSLRTILSFLGNAPYVTYLDDDNWVSPDHLRLLKDAVTDKIWAYGQRWFVQQDRTGPICIDQWESVGPDQGVFQKNFGGFVDTNSLILNTKACLSHFGLWSRPFLNAEEGRSADRFIFDRLRKMKPYGKTDKPTTSYVVTDQETNGPARLEYIKTHKLKTGLKACPGWSAPPDRPALKRSNPSRQSGQIQLIGDHALPFDIAVIVPTLSRNSLKKAITSILKQDFKGRIQILVGLDKAGPSRQAFEDLGRLCLPKNRAILLFDAGYSTSQRHGGIFQSYDGGALRVILSFLAHAPFVAYLDDDNWFLPTHLSSLYKAIQNHDWAYSYRRFIHPDRKTLVGLDKWESVGVNKGLYAARFQGFCDPNTVMIRTKTMSDVFVCWTLPLQKDSSHMSADRTVFHYLRQKGKGNPTHQASVDYVMQAVDPQNGVRKPVLGMAWTCAEINSFKIRNDLALDCLLKQGDQFNAQNRQKE